MGAKAGIPTHIVYSGLQALFFFAWVFWRSWRQTNLLGSNPLLIYLSRSMLLFMLLTIGLAADMNTLYIYLFPIVVLNLAPRLVVTHS